MAFQSQRYDQSQTLAQRLAQSADAQRPNDAVAARAEEFARKVAVKNAGIANMKRMQKEYADMGIDIGGEMDKDGNIQWQHEANVFDKLRAAAQDISKRPVNQVALRSGMGSQQQNVYATQDPTTDQMSTIESGQPDNVVSEQERLAQSAKRTVAPQQQNNLQQLASSVTPSQPLAQQANAQSIIFGNNQTQQAQQPQTPQTSLPNSQPIQPQTVRTGEKVDIQQAGSQSDQFSGSAQPLQTNIAYQQGGYQDPNREMAAQRLRNRMYGTQGDVQRGLRLTEGQTEEERTGAQDMQNLQSRYKDSNTQTMQPQMQGQMSGGAISQSSGQSQNFNNQFSKSKTDTAASRAAAENKPQFITDAISGAGGQDIGNIIYQTDPATGASIVKAVAGNQNSMIPLKTLKAIQSGKLNDFDFAPSEKKIVDTWLSNGTLNPETGQFKKDIKVTPDVQRLLRKLREEHGKDKAQTYTPGVFPNYKGDPDASEAAKLKASGQWKQNMGY